MVRRQKCIVPDCSVDNKDETEYETMDQAIRVMDQHMDAHKMANAASVLAPPVVANSQSQGRILKSIPPKLEMGISVQEWEYFLGDWRQHMSYCGLVEQKDLVYNLWQCLN